MKNVDMVDPPLLHTEAHEERAGRSGLMKKG